jgi:hypothetical protein
MTSLARAATPCLLAFSLFARAVHAQPRPQDKAAAEALFQAGTKLIDQARYPEACQKFEASYALDAALGTRLRLADCYDRIGRTASAWALFVEVVAVARSQGQRERETIAAVRVRDLETRLSRLTLKLDTDRAPRGLEVTLNGSAIPNASWQVPIPVDPGPQTITASAPGHQPWTQRVEVPSGPSARSVDIPVLVLAPSAVHAEPTTAPLVKPGHAGETAATAPSRPLLWAGVITGSVGLVGVGVASVLGYRAYDRNRESLDSCSSADANACTPHGKQLRDDAQDLARASTISAVIGGALLATGVTLLVLAPSADRTAASQLHLEAFGGAGAGRLQLRGAF